MNNFTQTAKLWIQKEFTNFTLEDIKGQSEIIFQKI